ncbi:hypothetical protein [uncultured Methanolobus sp.]|uniref:hypothetical protein n=1 Tax=uncultured Methanolobus sp. TaxID=218300 RepID=UPI002AAB774C|nr:hypothetical protein [uncultured Methanolobus sp.]
MHKVKTVGSGYAHASGTIKKSKKGIESLNDNNPSTNTPHPLILHFWCQMKDTGLWCPIMDMA